MVLCGWYILVILLFVAYGKPVLGAPPGLKPLHEKKLTRHQSPQGMRPVTKKIAKSPRNQYSPAHRESMQRWDNIDHLVFNDKYTDCNSWVYGGGKALAFLHMRKVLFACIEKFICIVVIYLVPLSRLGELFFSDCCRSGFFIRIV